MKGGTPYKSEGVLKAKYVTHGGTAKPVQQYTGDKVVGIAVMHKSCLQPIFNNEQAVDSAHMRR